MFFASILIFSFLLLCCSPVQVLSHTNRTAQAFQSDEGNKTGQFKAGKMTIKPDTIEIDQLTNICLPLKNIGDQKGIFTASLMINEQDVDS
jgi:hypothetical protein